MNRRRHRHSPWERVEQLSLTLTMTKKWLTKNLKRRPQLDQDQVWDLYVWACSFSPLIIFLIAASSWSLWEETTFLRAQLVYGMDCCAIARMIQGRPCREIALRVASNPVAEGAASAGAIRRKTKSSRKVMHLLHCLHTCCIVYIHCI